MNSTSHERSYLRRRVDELRGEAGRIRAFVALKAHLWRGCGRARAELQHLKAAADEPEADAAESFEGIPKAGKRRKRLGRERQKRWLEESSPR